ncbi:MAG TPA: DUF1805 domain-containing protein [Candidatus Hydrogenedentes bacterium]|nr:DUF1805 domain-containing protein [Candidatus Hydrogenedentota bacterium]HPG66103.1 DUF1805 domain-containing protein [Candidatus Hydrogenedentota bacterium]
MAITITSMACHGAPASGLAVSWSDSQFVMIIADKGLVACGVVDKEVMERAGAAIAIARGTREKPLKTVEDLLGARIADITAKAAAYGVQPGMSGQEALDLLCR